MKVKVLPSALGGAVSSVSSKSALHRLLILSALADSKTKINFTDAGTDVRTTATCLMKLGAGIDKTADGVIIAPLRRNRIPDNVQMNCRESGSTLRFLLPLCSALGTCAHFTGTGRLPLRPIKELTQALRSGGISFTGSTLPFTAEGKLSAGNFNLPGNISSQYISGMLMALPLLTGSSSVTVTNELQSSSYVALTLQILQKFGVEYNVKDNIFTVKGPVSFLSPLEITAENDWSQAAFFLAAGALHRPVTVTGLDLNSLQPDRRILDDLKAFGAVISADDAAVTVSPGTLRGTEIDLRETPDLLPVLAVIAASAVGETHFVHGERLRFKETDRIKTTGALLRSFDGYAEETPDGLIIRGGPLRGAVLPAVSDHRLIMAAALAASSAVGETIICETEAVNKSYPCFWDDFKTSGGKIDVL